VLTCIGLDCTHKGYATRVASSIDKALVERVYILTETPVYGHAL